MQDSVHKLIHTFAALADLSQEIADTTNFEEMVRASLHHLLGALAILRGAIAEHTSSSGELKFVATRSLRVGFPENVHLGIDDVEALQSFGLRCLTVKGAPPEFEKVVERHRTLFDNLRAELCVPLVIRGHLRGLIFLGGKASGESFTPDDCEVICAMARHIGVGIHAHRLLEEVENRAEENRSLYDGLRAIYKDTVRAFAAAIDIKDKYTQGHSERVGKYSEIIAREMGWSEEEVEGIAIAGYLHDVGKLVVDRDIINAPYRIDAKHSSELNRHPAAGYEILKPIQHPYADIPLMARYHHERLDGRGYPDGLKADEIPIGAKIVCLADSFDAMTTDRPYRTRRSFEDVITDFRRNTGKQFAPEVVAAFCRAILKEMRGEVKERRIIRMLGKGYLSPERDVPLITTLIAELDAAMNSPLASVSTAEH